MAYKKLLITLIILFPGIIYAQSGRYNIDLAPDLWYNKVDGIRIGMNIMGEQVGTFRDGAHRLNAGIWLGTKFPDLPVSYYLSFTEPISSISSLGNEGNLRLESSIRTGFSTHKISLNKRFQNDFNELKYREFSLSISHQKMFDGEYRHFPDFWNEDWKTLAGLDIRTSGLSPFGRFLTKAKLVHNLNSNSGIFSASKLELRHLTEFGSGFSLNLRTFGGWISEDAPYEYRFSLAHREPVYWNQNGFSRAQGTIPNTFFENGLIHVNGGMNLRGYADHYFSPLTTVFSFNTEFVFPNPIQAILNKNIIGDFTKFKSYLFFDAGTFRGEDSFRSIIPVEISNTIADAGIGFQFSINIPDYLGKDRGFAIRYEIPLWLSDPANPFNFETGDAITIIPHFKWRNLIGFGAVISF